MRASELRMNELIQFLPEDGKVILNGSRVLIFDAPALGKLRKDLIETLGIDRAKGFLIRYGWSCGFEAAMSIKEQYQWDNEWEWLYAGPLMHTLTGNALVTPLTINVDRQKFSWFFKSRFNNSFEAEQHILHFGLHHEPVCWMLVGWAGGYGSAYLGKKVIYKEVKCVGKGDDHCIVIGKTVEEWGEEIVPELAYYEMNKISEELEAANRRIVVQNRVLERTVTIHEQLTQCILKGKGIEDITATLAELMKCTVILEDRQLFPQFIRFPQQAAAKDSLNPYLPISTSHSFNKSSLFYRQQRRPFQLADQHNDLTVYRLVSPIIVGSELLGFVSLIRWELPFSELDNIALEHAASVFALEMLEEKKIADVERRLKGDFVDDLLSGNFSDPNSIIMRARGLQYDINTPHRVLVLDINNFTRLAESFRQNEKKILQFKTELASNVQSSLARLGKGMVVNKSGNLILLVQHNIPECPEKEVRQLAQSIIKEATNRFSGITLMIGIGCVCRNLEDFHHSFQSAQKAIEIGKVLKKQGQVVSLEQFGAHALLFSAINPADLYKFATDQVGRLLEYDETYQAELISTLQEFLNNRCNIEKTARCLNLSVSGLKYRLQRIEEITGQELRNSLAGLNLQLALLILQLAGKDVFGMLLIP